MDEKTLISYIWSCAFTCIVLIGGFIWGGISVEDHIQAKYDCKPRK